VNTNDVELREGLESERLPQIMELYAGEWWTAGRSASDVERMLRASDLVFCLVDRSTDRRWGFTDQVGRSRLMRKTSDQRLVASTSPATDLADSPGR
jgi:hypothetical protein